MIQYLCKKVVYLLQSRPKACQLAELYGTTAGPVALDRRCMGHQIANVEKLRMRATVDCRSLTMKPLLFTRSAIEGNPAVFQWIRQPTQASL